MSDPLNPKRTKSVSLEATMMKRIGELNVERIHNLNQIVGLQEEVQRLLKELAEAQDNYHLVKEMVAKLLKEGKQS